MRDDLKLVFVGGRTFSKYVLRSLVEHGWSVALVIEPKAGENVDYTSMVDICNANGIPLERVDDINDTAVTNKVRDVAPDVGVCCGWYDILDLELLEVPVHGFLGIHASDLPRGRGGAPVNWQLIHGFDEVGLSIFQFVPEIDDGALYKQGTVDIERRDDIKTVYDKVTVTSRRLLNETLAEIDEGVAEPQAQDTGSATYWPQRKPADGIIEWNRTPREIWNWIRAQTHPYPGAYTFFEEEQLRVWDAEVKDKSYDREGGEVVRHVPGAGIDVAARGGIVRLTRIQLGDRPPQWADEAAQDFGITPGTRLGQPRHIPEWTHTNIRDATGGYAYKTNIEAGEAAEFTVRGASFPDAQKFSIFVKLDGGQIRSERLEKRGWWNVRFQTRPLDRGAHTLTVSCTTEGYDDTRVLKIYVD